MKVDPGTLTKKKQLEQTEAAELGFLRPVGGYHRIHQSRNADIVQELNVFDLCEKINECQQNDN
jgi:hypothetical protein